MDDASTSVKVPNKALHRFLTRSPAEEECSVIIEIDVPDPQVEVVRDPRHPRPVRVGFSSSDVREKTEEKLEQAREFLTRVLGTPPQELRAAHAFAATVTPTQLLSVVKSPLTRAVRPNRRVRAPAVEEQPFEPEALVRKLDSSVPRRVEQGLAGLREHLERGGALSHETWMKVAAMLHSSASPNLRAACVEVFRVGRQAGPHQQLMRYWVESKPKEIRLHQALQAYFRDVKAAFMYLLASVRHRKLPRHVGEGVLQLFQTKLHQDHQSGGEELGDAELETMALTAEALLEHNRPLANQIYYQITEKNLY